VKISARVSAPQVEFHHVYLAADGAPSLSIGVQFADQASKVFCAYRERYQFGASEMEAGCGNICNSFGDIGASGSGKSTLARLLVRGADPDSGCILLEENPLACYTLASLRTAVCFVPQHPQLFEGTVRENLLYGNPRANAAEMDQVIQTAQLTPFVSQLPYGIDTQLGPGGAGLSGGERQRLAIARALLRNSAILVLDEATSALDVPTEFAVLASLQRYCAHQTLVIISHRISSLAWVDQLILLDQGRVAAVGSHSDLYARYALYRKRQTKCMVGIFAAHAAGVKSAML
jgi:ABC-type multidrug transport system fused ATPase/permease subunit